MEKTNSTADIEIEIDIDIDTDIENYFLNYLSKYTVKGPYLIERVLYIANNCTRLREIGFLKAVDLIKSYSKNTEKYKEIIETLKEINSEKYGYLDDEWSLITANENKSRLQDLENQLRDYKNSLVRDCTRLGYDEIGNYYVSTGDYSAACNQFSLEKEYCVTQAENSSMYFQILNSACLGRNWIQFQSALTKLVSLNADKYFNHPRVLLFRAIKALNLFIYEDVSDNLLRIPITGFDKISDMVTIENIATYITLCALATYDREKIRALYVSNQNFLNYTETEIYLRTLLSSFIQADYITTLHLINSHYDDFRLDLFIGNFAEDLLEKIQKRCFLQFLKPHSKVTYDYMSSRFNIPKDKIESIMEILILEDNLNYRLDSTNELILSSIPSRRITTYLNTLDASNQVKESFAPLFTFLQAKTNGFIVET